MTWLEMAAILLMQTAARRRESAVESSSAATGEPVSGAQVTIVPAAPGPGGAGRIVTGSIQGVIGGGTLPVPIPLPDSLEGFREFLKPPPRATDDSHFRI